MWTDIGVNLASKQFANDWQHVAHAAKVNGVDTLIITGTRIAESRQALSMADVLQQYATVGVHPHHAAGWNEERTQEVTALASHGRAVAIGECGLDFDRNYAKPEEQEIAFSAQLQIAAALNKPVFLHCRDAHDRFLEILAPWLPALPGAVLHCFTGTKTELEACLSAGLFIGITGWVCDERRGNELREIVPRIPLTRILLETDAPYLLPRDLNPRPLSRRNEPRYLPHIGQTVASLMGVTATHLAQASSENAKYLFWLKENARS